MRVQYNAKVEYAPINIFVHTNDLEVVTVDDMYIAIGHMELTNLLDEAIILHPEYARKLRRELQESNPHKEIYVWRYHDLLRYTKDELRKMKKIKFK